MENTVEPGRPQMTKWRMRIAYWTSKTTYTHSEYVILNAFPLQQWLNKRASMLRFTHNACLVAFGLPQWCGYQLYTFILSNHPNTAHQLPGQNVKREFERRILLLIFSFLQKNFF